MRKPQAAQRPPEARARIRGLRHVRLAGDSLDGLGEPGPGHDDAGRRLFREQDEVGGYSIMAAKRGLLSVLSPI